MKRHFTRPITLGHCTIGGDSPVTVQSMTKTDTTDVEATVTQIDELVSLGCDIIRLAVPTQAAAEALARIVPRSTIPVVADIHFDHRLALAALHAGVHGVRINPGNMTDRDGLKAVVDLAGRCGAAIRVGVNSGSVRGDTLSTRRDEAETPEELADLMVEKVLADVALLEEMGFTNMKLSAKASDVPTTLEVYRRLAERTDYPLHVGLTAAGTLEDSVVKSSVAIGALLAEGIGDTIRVSITGRPHDEVATGRQILEALGLREKTGPELISCPTCGRCSIDIEKVVRQVRDRLPEGLPPMTIAVMGCIVNGPGEARDCRFGIAGGKDFGYLFSFGEKLKKVPADRLVDDLVDLVKKETRNE